MERMSTLHEIAYRYAEKQSDIVDAITEEAPILQVVKWKPTNKGLENVVPVLTDVKGAGFVEMNAPLPFMTASRDLQKTHVIKWGATDEITKDAALMFGDGNEWAGATKYFAENFQWQLKRSCSDLEADLFIKYWLGCAKRTYADKKNTLIDAGSTAQNAFHLLAVHFDEKYNVGIYDPRQYQSGSFFKITYPYGQNLHVLHGEGNQMIYGYSVIYECLIGYQIIDAMADRCCAAIVNIDDDHLPTDIMIDDLLEQVRAQPANTYLFCAPKVLSHALKQYKKDRVQMTSSETDIKTAVQSWDGIPIITSNNSQIRKPMPRIEVA